MTENPDETLCSTKFYDQIKRELNYSSCCSDGVLGVYNGLNTARFHQQPPLTDSTRLPQTVLIALDNLKYSIDSEPHTYRVASKPFDIANPNDANANDNQAIVSDNCYAEDTEKGAAEGVSLIHGPKQCAAHQNTSHNKVNCADRRRNNQSNSTKMSSPESDCNSNVHMHALQQLATSIASSHDFTHDNSDYQWFLDYK